jgi:hypothetical protein
MVLSFINGAIIIAVPADPGSVLFRDKAVNGPGCQTAPPAAK